MEAVTFPYRELRRGDTAALRFWLARGGQIDAPLLGPIAETWTPLMLASAEGDVTLLRAIIETGGARVSASIGTKVLASYTPLHVASRYGHTGVVATLLELGAVVDARDTIGMTSLHYSAGNGHLRTIEVLLEAGAEVSAEGPGGATALNIAEMAGHQDAVALLERRALGGETKAARRQALGSWLQELGCEEFLARFLRAGYDDLHFMASQGLSETDLDCVGVPGEKLGLRKKLLVMHNVEQFLGDVGKDEGDDESSGTEGASTATTTKSGDNSSGSADDETVEEEESSGDESSSSNGSDAESSD